MTGNGTRLDCSAENLKQLRQSTGFLAFSASLRCSKTTSRYAVRDFIVNVVFFAVGVVFVVVVFVAGSEQIVISMTGHIKAMAGFALAY